MGSSSVGRCSAAYLARDLLVQAGELLERYESDDSMAFGWGTVLLQLLLEDRDAAEDLLDAVRADNVHIEDFLTGAQRIPADLPDYHGAGDEAEAIHCAIVLREAWRRHRKALAWLRSV